MIMKRQKIRVKRKKKYRPRAFDVHGKEIFRKKKPLWERIFNTTLMIIAGLLLILGMIAKVRHFFIKHW